MPLLELSNTLVFAKKIRSALDMIREPQKNKGDELEGLLLSYYEQKELLLSDYEVAQLPFLATQRIIESGLARLAVVAPDEAKLLRWRYYENISLEKIMERQQDEGELTNYSGTRRYIQERLVSKLAELIRQQEQTCRDEHISAQRRRLPPHDASQFVGRRELLDELCTKLTDLDNFHVVNLAGLSGLGKSVLARQAVEVLLADLQFLEIIWFSVGKSNLHTSGFDGDFSLQNTITFLLREMQLHDWLYASREEQLAAIRRQLQLGRHLFVIDDLPVGRLDEDLVLLLREVTRPGKILITSQIHLASTYALVISVPPFTQVETAQYIDKHAQELGLLPLTQLDETHYQRIYDRIGGHGVALQIFVRLGRHLSVDALLQAFELAKSGRIVQLNEAIYKRTWSYLPTLARKVMFAMTFVNDDGMSVPYLARLADTDDAALFDPIWELCNAGLLNKHVLEGEIAYFSHGLTDTFVYQQWQDMAGMDAEVERMIDAAGAYWLELREAGMTLPDFERVSGKMLQLVEMAITRPGSHHTITTLITEFHHLIDKSYFWRHWLAASQSLNEKLTLSNITLQRRLLSHIGWLLRHDDASQALTYHQHAYELAQQANDLRAMGRESLYTGIDHRRLGQYAEAHHWTTQAVDMFEEAPEVTPAHFASAHNAVGLSAFWQTKFDEALENYQEAARHAQSIGDTFRLIDIYNNWGNVLTSLGQYEQALVHFEQARHFAQEQGSKLHQIMVNISQCACYLEATQIAKAQELLAYLQRAEKTTYIPIDYRILIQRLLGLTAFHLNKYETAKSYLEKGLELATKTPNVVTQLELFLLLAQTYRQLNLLDLVEQTLATATKLRHENQHVAWVQQIWEKYNGQPKID